MLLSAVQIKAQHRVAVGAVLDALGAGLMAGLQDLHVGLGASGSVMVPVALASV